MSKREGKERETGRREEGNSTWRRILGWNKAKRLRSNQNLGFRSELFSWEDKGNRVHVHLCRLMITYHISGNLFIPGEQHTSRSWLAAPLDFGAKGWQGWLYLSNKHKHLLWWWGSPGVQCHLHNSNTQVKQSHTLVTTGCLSSHTIPGSTSIHFLD